MRLGWLFVSKRNFSPKSHQPDSLYRLRQAALHILFFLLYHLQRADIALQAGVVYFFILFYFHFLIHSSLMSRLRLVDRNHERTKVSGVADMIKTEEREREPLKS
jgi:hypothetical protein